MRILLLTLYYPPLNTIAALRIKAFEKYFKAEGHQVDIITRYYDEQQQQGKSMFLGSESPENFNVPYIKQDHVIYTNFKARNEKKDFSEKLPPFIKGIYNYLNVDIYHYSWLSYVLLAFDKELKPNKYDFIIASYGPPITLLAAKKLWERYKIPYIIDFRDNFITEKDAFYQLFMKKRVQYNLLKNAKGLIFATEGMRSFFERDLNEKLKRIPTTVIYNGVDDHSEHYDLADEKIVQTFNKLQRSSSFVLLHTGTLYEGQNISFFTQNLEIFNSKYNTKGVIVFLGLAQNTFTSKLESAYVYELPKVKHTTAIYLQKKAFALILPVWNGRYTGFSGKTLEYIFSENFIIISPNPQDDLREFLAISPNAIIANDTKAFEETINRLRDKRQVKQPLENAERLHRSYWIKKLIGFLLNLK